MYNSILNILKTKYKTKYKLLSSVRRFHTNYNYMLFTKIVLHLSIKTSELMTYKFIFNKQAEIVKRKSLRLFVHNKKHRPFSEIKRNGFLGLS